MRVKNLLFLLLAVVTMAGFTSCDDDEDNPYNSPLVGMWQLDDTYSYDRFTFYDNGTGYYEGINEFGQWDSWDINWESHNGSRLSVYFLQSGDWWEYYYRFQSGYLVLTYADTGEELWYRRAY